jgi:hypothetical protein
MAVPDSAVVTRLLIHNEKYVLMVQQSEMFCTSLSKVPTA